MSSTGTTVDPFFLASATQGQNIQTNSNRPRSLAIFDSEGHATSRTPMGQVCNDANDAGDVQIQQQTYGPSISMGQVLGNVFIGTSNGNLTQQTIEEFHVLRNLPIHPDISGHLSEYFPNSRADDEARILQWIDSSHPPELVLCVLGKVGVGKSTLAKHLATRLRQDGRLAAEVYLGFALPDWTPESVVRMAAGQLCGAYPALTRAVSEAIRLDVSPSISLETRIQKFILEPIQSLHLPGPLVVLLDALDQWAPHPILTEALGCLTTEAHIVRFVVLGRPGLEDRFQNVPYKLYDLQEVSKSVMGDYFRLKFEQVRWEYGRKPTSQMIDQLVDKANGLFIWSSILCSTLEDQIICPKPNDTLTAILQSQHSMGDDDILASLYHSAINLRFPKAAHKTKLKVYLEAVLVLQEPLPVAAFASLVSMETAVVRKIQTDLGPLQTGQAQEAQDIVYPASSTFHLSLLEYLKSPSIPSHLAFQVDTFTSHSRLGQACLDEIRRLPSSPQRSFTSPLQKYAMRYWPIHTANGTPSVTPISDAEWKATPHSAVLDSLSVQQWKHWATSYLQFVCPTAVGNLSTEEFTLPQALPAKHHSARKTIRLFLDKVFHRPSHETPVNSTRNTHRHFVPRVAQSLCGSWTTRGTPDAIAVADVGTRLEHQSSDAWLKLGQAYHDAAQISASSHLVDNAIRCYRYAAHLGGNQGYEVHQTLGVCLWLRFSRLGRREDLNEAIALEREVLGLTPPGHPDHAVSLNNLVQSLISYFDHWGATEILDDAIVLLREGLSLWPPGHLNRAVPLNNLANSLQSHFNHTGKTESLDEAITLHREGLSLWPPGHPDRAASLNNLASSLYSHFKHTGTIESQHEAIVLQREALSLRPPGHPDRAISLNSLANSLSSYFEHTGKIESLDEAITLQQEALSLRPPGHPDRATSLNNLAGFLSSYFSHTGATESLDEAITLLRAALSLLPPSRLDRAAYLHNLADSLNSHFDHTGMTESLDEAIALHREALLLWPPGHPRRAMSLNNLAVALDSHFEHTGKIESLDNAIVLLREALSLWPAGHPDRVLALNNLTHSLQSHSSYAGTAESIDEVILLYREAASLRPPGHPHHAMTLSSLSDALRASYKLTGNNDTLNEAMSLMPPDSQPAQ